jgi:hypothetical protein
MAEVKIRDANHQVMINQQANTDEEYFELQPVEKKLIGYSLSLGILLLIVFIFIFKPFS